MKKALLFMAITGFLAIHTAYAQEKGKIVPKDTVKQMNLIDQQVKILNGVFDMGNPNDNPFGGASNYKELLEKSELEEGFKKELMEQYKLYDLSTDPKKKDSLKLVFTQRLKKAMMQSNKN